MTGQLRDARLYAFDTIDDQIIVMQRRRIRRLRELQTRFGCRFLQVVCSAETAVLVERFTRRARAGELHPGHADASALDELIPRSVNERWDALDLDGPVIRVDTTKDVVDIQQLIRTYGSWLTNK